MSEHEQPTTSRLRHLVGALVACLCVALAVAVTAQPLPPTPPLVVPKPPTAPITLAWNPSPDARVVGYRIYWGIAHGLYTNSAAVGNVTNCVLTSLLMGQPYFYAATGYDSSGAESLPSNELTVTASTSQRVKIISRLGPSLTGPFTNGPVIWDVTDSPATSLFVTNHIEKTNWVKWQ